MAAGPPLSPARPPDKKGIIMDLKTLTDDELEQYRVDVLTEQERRARLASIPAQAADLARRFIADGGEAAAITEAVAQAVSA